MEAALSLAVPSNRSRWTGRIVSAVPALFLAFDVAIKLSGHPAVAEASARLGLPLEVTPVLGVVLAVCLALYLVPRTAPIGAVLLTGYLGGAVSIHMRVGDPLLSHTLFPIWVGAFVWLGLFLRDARVRALVS